MSVLEQAEKSRGLVTHDILNTNLNWDKQRSDLILGEISLEVNIKSDCSILRSNGWIRTVVGGQSGIQWVQ